MKRNILEDDLALKTRKFYCGLVRFFFFNSLSDRDNGQQEPHLFLAYFSKVSHRKLIPKVVPKRF